jgi:ER-bound oxygenase mpaB/B'/Rubber oxygenase, catalytic domain
MPMPFTDSYLDGLRADGDPPADDVVTAVLDGGPGVRELLAALRYNDEAVPTGLPAPLRQFLADTAVLPPWADPDRIERGAALFARLGPPAVAVLFCASLPHCYAAANGAQVLGMSQRLLRDPERRIVETAQFVLDVMAPGGLSTGGAGIRSAQKVRLLHAALRAMISADAGWNRGEWGRPINQEDLAGTLCTFSVVVLDGLVRLGADFTDEEERAYVHAWRVIGHLLGIRDELSCDEPAAARALFATICRRQQRPSPIGRDLTRQLLAFLDRMTPGTVFDGFAAALVHHLLGEEIAAMVDVPPPTRIAERLIRLATALTRDVDAVQDRSVLVRAIGERFARALLVGLEWVERGGRPVRFEIPERLRSEWSFLPAFR